MTEPSTTTTAESGQVVSIPKIGKVVAIASGKGGVGKTFVAANLAAALTRRGLKVLVLDADLGLANLDVVLNLHPKITLHDVFLGKSSLDEAILKAPGGFSVILAGSGLVEYSRLTRQISDQLLSVIQELVPRYDIVLLDTGAGISEVVLFSISLASEVILVVTPEPTSLTDAYATIKVLATQQKRQQVRLIINQSQQPGDGMAITNQLQAVLNRFLGAHTASAAQARSNVIRLLHLGDIPSDLSVKEAVMRRQLLFSIMPGAAASLAIGKLAGKLEAALIKP